MVLPEQVSHSGKQSTGADFPTDGPVHLTSESVILEPVEHNSHSSSSNCPLIPQEICCQ